MTTEGKGRTVGGGINKRYWEDPNSNYSNSKINTSVRNTFILNSSESPLK